MPWNTLPLEVKQLVIEHFLHLLSNDIPARVNHGRPFTDLIEVDYAFGQSVYLLVLKAVCAELRKEATQAYKSNLDGPPDIVHCYREAQSPRSMCLNLISVVIAKLDKLAVSALSDTIVFRVVR